MRDKNVSLYDLLIVSRIMGFRLVLIPVTLNDLERRNDRRRALSLR